MAEKGFNQLEKAFKNANKELGEKLDPGIRGTIENVSSEERKEENPISMTDIRGPVIAGGEEIPEKKGLELGDDEEMVGGNEKIRNRNLVGKEKILEKGKGEFIKGGAKAGVKKPEESTTSVPELAEIMGPQDREEQETEREGREKPKRKTKGRINYEKKFGSLGDTNQKLADLGEDLTSSEKYLNKLDSDETQKYGVIKGKAVKRKSAEPIVTRFDPKTGEIQTGKKKFSGEKESAAEKPKIEISDKFEVGNVVKVTLEKGDPKFGGGLIARDPERKVIKIEESLLKGAKAGDQILVKIESELTGRTKLKSGEISKFFLATPLVDQFTDVPRRIKGTGGREAGEAEQDEIKITDSRFDKLIDEDPQKAKKIIRGILDKW